MTHYLFALVSRARSITTLAVVMVAAGLIAAPTPARTMSGRPGPVLAQGAGMGVKPNAQVRERQRALYFRGYDLGPPGVDGRFGPRTAAAVRRVQADYELAVDGAVGDHTRRTLRLPSLTARRAQARSPARHRAAPEHNATSTRRSIARSVASPTTGPKTWPDRSEPSNSWLDSAIAAAVAGAIVCAFSALALRMGHGRRRHPGSTMSLRRQAPAAEVTSPTQDEHSDNETPHVADHDNTAERVRGGAADRRSPSQVPAGHCLIGYLTVSADSGSGEAQRSSAAIEAMCERSDWNLLEIVRDRENGRILERPGLGYALERIADGHARGLVVSDLEPLSRSIVDLGALMAWFRDADATLIALDLDIDTSTPEGHHVATTLIALSTREHERLANRTHGRADGRASGRSNRRLAVSDDPTLLERITTMRAASMTLQAIADRLNAEKVPTLRGGMEWRPSSIQTALGYRRPGPREHLPPLKQARP